MKFSTFHFSGTGNTRWAVETFNAIISAKGHQAAMFSIDIGETWTMIRFWKLSGRRTASVWPIPSTAAGCPRL